VSQPTGSARRSSLSVVVLCFLTIVFDGYDLIVYGSAVPSLLAEPGWNLGPAGAVVGPLFGGWVLASGIGFERNFYGFAVPALAGALLIGLVPRAAAGNEASPTPATIAAATGATGTGTNSGSTDSTDSTKEETTA
jgi:hypothetical protein